MNPHFLSVRLEEALPALNFIRKSVFLILCVPVFGSIDIEGTFKLAPASLHAEEPAFENFLKTATQKIHKVTSDQQAQAFVLKTMGPFLPRIVTQDIRSRRPMEYTLSATLKDKMVKLAKELAIWHFASDIEKQLLLKKPSMVLPLNSVATSSLNWLINSNFSIPFHQVFSLTNSYLELKRFSDSERKELPRFSEYLQYLKKNYPSWKNHNDRLYAVAEKEGAIGIIERLQEYWERDNSKKI